MADKTYSEDEHLAILSDRVTKETAELTGTVNGQKTAITDLETKLDVETSAKTAAEQRATEAEKALEDFKADVTEREAAAARKDERVKKAREAASHLGDEFFEDEKRVERIVAMSDEQFEGYLGDLGVTAKVTPGKTAIPRETAMQGKQAGDAKASAGRDFLLRGFVDPGKES